MREETLLSPVSESTSCCLQAEALMSPKVSTGGRTVRSAGGMNFFLQQAEAQLGALLFPTGGSTVGCICVSNRQKGFCFQQAEALLFPTGWSTVGSTLTQQEKAFRSSTVGSTSVSNRRKQWQSTVGSTSVSNGRKQSQKHRRKHSRKHFCVQEAEGSIISAAEIHFNLSPFFPFFYCLH